MELELPNIQDLIATINLKEYFDQLIRDNQSVFENPFIEHLFFDHYIKKGNGNEPLKVIQIFHYLLHFYQGSQYDIIRQNLENLLSDSIHLSNMMVKDTYLNFEGETIKRLKEKGAILLAGGWSGFHNDSGHVVTLYFVKTDEDVYDLYIFNSGAGVDYHYQLMTTKRDKNIIQKGPIGILIKNLTEDDIKIILKNQKKIKFSQELKMNYQKIKNDIEHIFQIKIENGSIEENNRRLEEKIIYDIDNIRTWSNISFQFSQVSGFQLEGISSFVEFMSPTNFELRKHRYFRKNDNKFKYDSFLNDRFRNEIIHQDFNYDKADEINEFYTPILLLLSQQKTIEISLTDTLQLSSSCSFFSIYYFIKFYFIQNIRPEGVGVKVFEHFDNFIRRLTLELILGDKYFEFTFQKDKLQKYKDEYKSCLYILNKDYRNRYSDLHFLQKYYQTLDTIDSEEFIEFNIRNNGESTLKNQIILENYDTLIKKIINEKIFDLYLYQEFMKKIQNENHSENFLMFLKFLHYNIVYIVNQLEREYDVRYQDKLIRLDNEGFIIGDGSNYTDFNIEEYFYDFIDHRYGYSEGTERIFDSEFFKLYFLYIIFNSDEVERGSIPANEYSIENVYKILWIFMTEVDIEELMNITNKSFLYIIGKFLRFGMIDPFLEDTSKNYKNPFSLLSQIDYSINKKNIKKTILNNLIHKDFDRKIECKNQNNFISGIVYSINIDNPLIKDIMNLSLYDNIFYYYQILYLIY